MWFVSNWVCWTWWMPSWYYGDANVYFLSLYNSTILICCADLAFSSLLSKQSDHDKDVFWFDWIENYPVPRSQNLSRPMKSRLRIWGVFIGRDFPRSRCGIPQLLINIGIIILNSITFLNLWLTFAVHYFYSINDNLLINFFLISRTTCVFVVVVPGPPTRL